MSVVTRLVIRLYIDGRLTEEERVQWTAEQAAAAIPAMATRHARLSVERLAMVELEFLDEPELAKRFLRFGSDPPAMNVEKGNDVKNENRRPGEARHRQQCHDQVRGRNPVRHDEPGAGPGCHRRALRLVASILLAGGSSAHRRGFDGGIGAGEGAVGNRIGMKPDRGADRLAEDSS